MSAHGSGERSHAPLLALLRAVGRALQGLPRSLALLPVGAWMALIWWLSSLSGDAGPPSILGGFVNNLAHAPLFGLLALWLALLLPRSNGWPRLDRRTATQVLLAVLAYALLDEWHQSTSPGRVPSPYDVLTDLVGAACTLWIIAFAGRPNATQRGLSLRLVAGVGACCAAALLATFEPFLAPPVP